MTHTLTTDSPHPGAYEATALAAMERAYNLSRVAHAAMSEAVHGAPSHFTEEQKEQRKALIKIVSAILEKARNREMDEAVAHWLVYKRMIKE